jgi:hypothetical protein
VSVETLGKILPGPGVIVGAIALKTTRINLLARATIPDYPSK